MRKPLRESNILIVGVARDCERVIRSEVQKIDYAFRTAKSAHWLIVESDSSDSTASVLESMSEKLSLRYQSLGKLEGKLNKRTERIAACRNRYIDAIRNDDDYALIDFVVVADLDGVNCNLTSDSVMSCWDMKEDWDACFANQSVAYYDIWALRHETWSPCDCWDAYKFLVQHGLSHFEALNVSVYSRMITIKESDEPIKVRSAFGGIAIYKKNLFQESSYIGLLDNGGEVCEHVTFNETLHNQGYSLYINPKFINCGWNDHNKNIKIISNFKARLRYYTERLISKIFSKI